MKITEAHEIERSITESEAIVWLEMLRFFSTKPADRIRPSRHLRDAPREQTMMSAAWEIVNDGISD